MNYKDILKNARENLNGSCRVCRVCNGKACSGEVPGMGGKGTGDAFTINIDALDSYKLNMRLIHDVKNPDISVELFGKKMDMPVFAAPVSGTTLNMGGKFTEEEYISWVIGGCRDAGIYPMVGDTAVDSFLITNLDELKKFNGEGIAIIKPWENDNVINKIKLAEEAGAYAVGMDIDAAGLITLALHGKPVGPKTVEEIKEIVKSTKLPFILKGIMTVEDAKLAVEAGVDAIVVSNHGGRVLDQTPGVADVLPEIAEAVKGKVTILADGGVRTGVDVLKMIALGADAVLIGRPFVTASFGGEREGVKIYVENLKSELKSAMVLTGCNSIKDIDEKIIY
ncbi:alpha-hydroxy-acid oxidizing protein [Clostridium botulinum]|uniref:L-lactate oxidase n=1 Tax=Clostridium botulinum (strain Hall / ATCC 3502 / NCTC 13319 / Type A) TaxID=441771 RepID=A5I6K0_CLOBH|nr:alpha-hydroxy-acid oxidizing protein [Clostridium botulinum]EPS47144.1 dehydrogenase, FMN-dependent [Clostridium botulinum CFSAN002367]ABS34353.1 dehydrogenase, FMN-dependent [Clostridium botulinum A str. ATCC 19397]AWB18934.1 alpha-hydroxy-acid oxidizing protein [Clostridium botulinum]AWB31747.1 alpha-hydroxy-acid oxidizing protein [Clostridium botulinum]EGT5617068.1 alpha-hydroxy-acid oxidizing protein [Clostridium botulinum]